jgi:hypothetical protein
MNLVWYCERCGKVYGGGTYRGDAPCCPVHRGLALKRLKAADLPDAALAERYRTAILHLFLEAEHDHARLKMLMALRDFLGFGYNAGDDPDADLPQGAAIIEAARRVLYQDAQA